MPVDQVTFVLSEALPEPAMGLLEASGQPVRFVKSMMPEELAGLSGPLVLLTRLTETIDQRVITSNDVIGVSNYAAGVDNIDLAAARDLKCRIGHTPNVLTDDTADIAMLLMLSASRRFQEGTEDVRTGKFTGWKPNYLLGKSLTGAKLGLVGSGRIATAVARRASAFEMEVEYCSVRNEAKSAGETALDVIARKTSFDEVVANSDFVSIHVPLVAETHHLFNSRVFSHMRRSAILINTARGPIVSEADLIEALHHREIAGAGLDVFEFEPAIDERLLALKNVVVLPHLGSATVETRAKMSEICAQNALAIAVQGPMRAEVKL